MATCPSGHESASEDFCDVCGYLISAAPSLGQPAAEPTLIGTPPPAQACPRCGTPRFGQFCEACGYDFAAAGPDGAPPATRPSPSGPAAPPATRPVAVPAMSGPPGTAAAGTGWTAVVTADRAYYESVQAEGGPDAPGIEFPRYYPERRFQLSGTEVRIGRHSAHSGIDPEIDLAVPPADPGVSRLHAVLIRAADGSWAVLDPGSANGTLVNGREIPSDRAVPLRDGDRIHLGAWTELRVIREA